MFKVSLLSVSVVQQKDLQKGSLVYPNTIDELVTYLAGDEARVIVLTKT